MKMLLKYFLKTQWKKIIPLIIFQFIATSSQFYGIYLVGKILNLALKGKNLELLGKNEIILIVATIITILALLAVYYIAVNIASSTGYNIRKRLFHVYANAPIGEIQKFKSTGLMSRTTRGMFTMRNFIFNVLGFSSLIPFVFLIMYLELNYMSSFLGTVYLILMAMLLVFVYIIVRYACDHYFGLKKTFAGINFLFRQGALMFDNVRLNNKQKYEKEAFQGAIETSYNTSLNYSKRTSYFYPLFLIIFNLFIVVMIIFTTREVISVRMDMLEVVIFFQWVLFTLGSIKTLPTIFNSLTKVNGTSKRIEEVLILEDMLEEEDYEFKNNDNQNIIEFNDVSFKYGTEDVISDMTFNVEKESTIAIVGKTASGKSTVLSLLNGLYPCTNGEIKIDGNDINQIKSKDLKSKLSFATQKSFLFNDTVKTNITLNNDSINTDEIHLSAELSGLDECVDDIDDFLEFKVNEKGVNLSTSIKSRLNIMRCLVKKADIYLFDNVFNTYDKNSQYKMFKKIKEHLKNKTIILVTDNIEILENMDKIILLDDGKISTIGTHSELIENSEYYKNLVNTDKGMLL
ncbi:ABC transporter ATP-binding protein [Methanosphaera sp. ISO3-F5]|uniref:ABC transporter ATP-binding protein n=1 Tax=Methanosphaera sp. ISO3-F5 TaxID=1452353 RepID=UPI002B25CC80|nr:ABC transporter ATP-binding protein [Methanosphaera sp. ISO3-F5]WQH64511.1 ABC transporter ATP-binding protein [Methanosphaera sp. ISO3-F5]